MATVRLRAWAWVLGAGLLWAASVSAPARAATFVPRTLAQLVQRSDATVLGHPVARRSFWRQGRIYTEVTLQLEEVWHGPLRPDAQLSVFTLGGEVEAIAQRVDGAAALPPYGRVVVHLQRVEGGWAPTAMAQGVWLVDDLYGSRAAVRPQVPEALPAGLRASQRPARQLPHLAALRAAVQEAALARP